MPNIIDANGLQTKTQAELITEFTTAFETIYGTDINLEQDSPDGQMMMIYIQSALDTLDLLTQIYNSFDPDNAIGTTLDQRVGINGIQRQGGTYTITPISITVTEGLTLTGLDDAVNEEDAYTVQDDEGNEWYLEETQSPASAGTNSYNFRAALPGEVLTTLNTITTPVTVVLGVTTINNPTTYTTLGIDEESNTDLKTRRRRSVSLSSQGFLPGLLASLENITGVTSASVYENNTAITDADGIPPNSIWVIVSGTAADADIATAIYQKRNAGAGMRGDETYEITQIDGSPFIIKWDEVITENLFIKFTAGSLDGISDPNYAAIKTYLVQNFQPGVFEKVNVNALSTAIQAADSNTLVTDEGFSDAAAGTYTDTLEPDTKQNQWVVLEANIIILPILPTPSSYEAVNGEELTFDAIGGSGALTWSLQVDNSGGSMSAGGDYIAGGSDGTDTVRVTDALGNFTDVLIVVT